MKVVVRRKEKFSSAHRLFSGALPASENASLFGKCVNLHGHNYTLDVGVSGPVDPVTGMVINLTDLKRIMVDKVVALVDHACVDDVPWFRDGARPSTAENIARWAFEVINKEIAPPARLVSVILYETDNNYVEVTNE
jgi:6-pyruvoyltetrahydropterin/6-carboxytetrahydropterin synthase